MDQDAVFKALADVHRRRLLDRLFDSNGLTLQQLCQALSISRQGVSKHLAVLEQAQLVVTLRRGRDKLHFLNPIPIHEIGERWIGKFQQRHLEALHNLKTRLEAEPPQEKENHG